ncbi:MAG: hypothetical protein M1833_001805 [Piccolia ochrophora]|nr:MAG: hypothetical protein M1833_001805 [Piccolia ochrophora]
MVSLKSGMKTPLVARYLQILLALIYFVLLCYASTHKGYWTDIRGPIALGVIVSLLTFGAVGYAIFCLHRGILAFGGKIFIRIPLELVLALAWIGSGVLMLRSDKGHSTDSSFDQDPPWPMWYVCVALAFIEGVSFLGAAFLVFKEGRGNKSGPAASYV